MIYLQLPSGALHRRLPFYLAMEEWAAECLPSGEYASTWVVEPTVICGRNQDISAEVDLAYCQANSIDVCRRRSGGGCVYADSGNVMISYIAPSSDVQSTFSRFSLMLARMLQALGLDAAATGRNDVVISGRKVSGAAFYHKPGRAIVHSTMLYATDMDHMLRAITPSRAKLLSKQVQSVASRITTVGEHLPALGMEAFRKHIIASLSDGGAIEITPAQVAEIEEYERRYYDPLWLQGRHRGPQPEAAPAMQAEASIPGVGTVQARLRLDPAGRIADAALSGDFFVVGDVDSLLSRLRGAALEPEALAVALGGADPTAAVAGLSTEALTALLMDCAANN